MGVFVGVGVCVGMPVAVGGTEILVDVGAGRRVSVGVNVGLAVGTAVSADTAAADGAGPWDLLGVPIGRCPANLPWSSGKVASRSAETSRCKSA
jgi:hypothetical protein